MDSTIINVECLDELADFAGIKPQVAAITEPYGIRHARLSLASDPTVVKTLSIDSILTDWRVRA